MHHVSRSFEWVMVQPREMGPSVSDLKYCFIFLMNMKMKNISFVRYQSFPPPQNFKDALSQFNQPQRSVCKENFELEIPGCTQWRLFERGFETHHQGRTYWFLKITLRFSGFYLSILQRHRLVTHFLTQVDEFTGKLWEIYETIKSEGGPVQVILCCW